MVVCVEYLKVTWIGHYCAHIITEVWCYPHYAVKPAVHPVLLLTLLAARLLQDFALPRDSARAAAGLALTVQKHRSAVVVAASCHHEQLGSALSIAHNSSTSALTPRTCIDMASQLILPTDII